MEHLSELVWKFGVQTSSDGWLLLLGFSEADLEVEEFLQETDKKLFDVMEDALD